MVSGFNEDAVDLLFDEELRELRVIGGRLATDADLAVLARAAAITSAIIFFTTSILMTLGFLLTSSGG